MDFKNILPKHVQRRHYKVLAFVVCVLCVCLALWLLWGAQKPTQPVFSPSNEEVTITNTTTEETVTASPSLPTQLRIPSIQVDAPFESPLGLTPEGAVEVPVAYETVGWYKYGPTPGEMGPAVIFGHVDTVDGPAVLYSLGQVRAGDEILIKRADGSTVIFAVQDFERVKQSEFPNDKVYGNIPYAGIRIITCTGVFDKKSQHYSHNLIVYGKLVSVQEPEREKKPDGQDSQTAL